jgi:hypothetical protein
MFLHMCDFNYVSGLCLCYIKRERFQNFQCYLKRKNEMACNYEQEDPTVSCICQFKDHRCHEDVLRKWRYSATHSLTSALDGGEWSASGPGRFTPSERTPVHIG